MRIALIMLAILIVVPDFARAQSETDELDAIEAELDKKAPKPLNKPPEEKPMNEEKLSDFSGLGKLNPFSDVAVIQKKFLPKTERFQLSGALTTITNDVFFLTGGFSGRLGYNFTEAWGLEFSYYGLSTSQKQPTKNLEKSQVKTDSLISAKSYYGADIVWSPIYGKMGWMNKRIVPFDMYFSLGGGSTQTSQGESVSTLHVGTGQIFAKNKSLAFRWDLSWNAYTAQKVPSFDKDGNFIGYDKPQAFNNLFLSMGVSFFFPEAKYR